MKMVNLLSFMVFMMITTISSITWDWMLWHQIVIQISGILVFVTGKTYE